MPRVACTVCDKEVYKSHYDIAHHKHHYCSKECQYEGQTRKTPLVTKDGYISPTGSVLEHRQVMATELGRPLTKKEKVHHKDEHKAHNDPTNLEVMTNSEHMRYHALKHGYVGDRNNNAKYTDAQLLECHAYVRQGHSIADASRKFNVSYNTLRSVLNGRHRAYLMELLP